MPSWNWDEEASGSGVVHESTANTDQNDAAVMRQGYEIANPYLSADLVGYWPLQEDSGSTAYDFSGSNEDGSIVGATLNVNGLLGTSAYTFDGTDDGIDISDASVYDLSASFTLSAWIKTTVTSGNIRVIEKQSGGDSGYRMAVENGAVEFGVYNSANNNGYTELVGSTTVADGNWHHIMGVYNDPDMTIYVDGQTDATGSQNGCGLNNHIVSIGYDSDSVGGSFDGKITEARIYNRNLSASENQTLYDVVNTTGEWVGNGKVL